MKWLLLFSALLWCVVGVLAGSAFSAAGGTNLPLKGSFSGTSELGGNDDQLHVSTAGLISHLGRTTVEQNGFAPYCSPLGCPDFSFPQPYPVRTSYTMTTANGAQSFGSCSGTATGTIQVHHASVTCVSSGGTGRLESVQLTFTMTWDTTDITIEENLVFAGQVEGSLVGSLSKH